jgi:uncharacterized membrane protein
MDLHQVLIFLASFAASAVEVVEAVTIVLAVGVTRGWRSTWIGVGAAALSLAVLVVVFGPALLTLVPHALLLVVIGTLLLIFGLQWVRKAVMRYTGLKALHDEALIYEREVDALRTGGAAVGAMDWTAFTVAFKGVFLEGLEVVFIVITFTATSGNFVLTTLGAAAAAIIVTVAAALLHRPLTRVPENTLKYGVGLMLVTFGTFWAGEGLGAEWPGGDWMILGLLLFYWVGTWAMITVLRRPVATPPAPRPLENRS